MTNKAYHGILGAFDSQKNLKTHLVHLEMEPGSTVFFGPLLFHGSGPNLSPNTRMAISTHYFNSSITKHVTIRDSVQSILEDEVKDEARKRFARLGADKGDLEEFVKNFHFRDYWAMKARVVRGNDELQAATEEECKRWSS